MKTDLLLSDLETVTEVAQKTSDMMLRANAGIAPGINDVKGLVDTIRPKNRTQELPQAICSAVRGGLLLEAGIFAGIINTVVKGSVADTDFGNLNANMVKRL